MAEYLSKDDISTGEYISRDEALKAMQYCCEKCDNYNGAMCRACDNADEMDIIIDMPAADVQPVKHGRWTDNVYKYVKSLDAYFIQAKCSVCGRYSDRIDIYSRFMSNECCSRCGARMDGDDK